METITLHLGALETSYGEIMGFSGEVSLKVVVDDNVEKLKTLLRETATFDVYIE